MLKQELEREFARRALVANCLLGSLQRVVANGPLLQLISMSQFALGDAHYATITAVFATANVAQLFGLISQYRSGVYRTLINSYRIRTVLLAIMAAMPIAFTSHSLASAIGFFLCAYLVCACHAAGFNVCWPSILRAGTNPKTRGYVTGNLRTTQVALAAAMVLGITLIGPPALSGLPFSALIGVFAIYSFVAVRQIEWMEGSTTLVPVQARESVFASMKRDVRRLLELPNYRHFLFFGVLLGLSVFPIQIYFLRDVVGLPTGALFWYSAALTWAGILSIHAWGKVIDRYSAWTGLRIGIAIVVASFILLLVAMAISSSEGPMHASLQAVVVLALLSMSIATQGIGLLWFNCSMDVVPAEATTLGVLALGLAHDLAAVFGAMLVTFLRGYAFEGIAHKEVLIVGLWCIASIAALWLVPGRTRALAQSQT